MKTRINELTTWVSGRIVGPMAVALALLVLVVSEMGFQRLQDISVYRSCLLYTSPSPRD